MSLPALATPSDLGTWLGQAIAADDARAQAVLDAASGLVRDAASQTWMTDDDPPVLVADLPQAAKTVTLTSAARAYLNPAGTSSSSTGPFTVAWSSGAGVMLTDHERALLASLQPGGNLGGLGVLATTRGHMETPLVCDPADYGIGGLIEADNPYLLWIAEQ